MYNENSWNRTWITNRCHHDTFLRKCFYCKNSKSYQYRWALSQPLPYDEFEFVEDISVFTHDVIINYDKFSDLGYRLVVGVYYPEHLQPSLHEKCPYSDLFWSEWGKIRTRKTPDTYTFQAVHYTETYVFYLKK